MSRFYELSDDRAYPGRWHLRSPVNASGERINPWQFFHAKPITEEGHIRFPVRPDGAELDFCWAAFSILVVNARFVNLFQRLGVQDVQFIPAGVEGHTGPFFILNTLRIIRCIDESRCEEVTHWRPEDGQPEKAGEYRSVAGLHIDPAKVGEARIFRTWGWTIAGLIISEDLKLALEREHITGTRFVEV